MIHTVDTIFHNRYQLRKIIGSGGMSSVWLASDILSETEVAVKIYNYEGDLNWKVKEAFVNEFKIMYNITHPYLFRPSHYDIDPGSQSPYLVSKYYPKGSAETIINTTNKALDENFIAEFMHDAASALNYLHSASIPIIHQDIKPDNFLIDDDGKFILSDFGISIRKRETRIIGLVDLTEDQVGDIPYSAPEKFKGAYPKAAQDIFSLGVTLFEILTGVLPFQNFGGKLLNEGYEVPSLDSDFGYSQRLNLICRQCMNYNPESRPNARKLIDWANFHKEYGYWPEIPEVNFSGLELKIRFDTFSNLFIKISTSWIDKLNDNEIKHCENDIKYLNNAKHEFKLPPNAEQVLKTLKKAKEQFLLLESDYSKAIMINELSIEELNNLESKYGAIKERISASLYNKRKEFFEQTRKSNQNNGHKIYLESSATERIRKVGVSIIKHNNNIYITGVIGLALLLFAFLVFLSGPIPVSSISKPNKDSFHVEPQIIPQINLPKAIVIRNDSLVKEPKKDVPLSMKSLNSNSDLNDKKNDKLISNAGIKIPKVPKSINSKKLREKEDLKTLPFKASTGAN